MPGKIIVNGRFLLHRITGVERYATELLRELDALVQEDEIELAVPPELETVPTYQNIRAKKVGRLHNRLWEHVSFPLYVRSRKGISLNLCNVAPLPSPGIVCLMDAKIKAHPEFFSKKFLLWYKLLFFNAARRAKRIITISEFSKQEIQKYWHMSNEKITVIPCAWQHIEGVEYSTSAVEKYGLTKGEYYYTVSSLEPNKNLKWIANAARNDPDHVYAVSGSINEKVFAEGLGFDCPSNIRLLGYTPDDEVKSLMRDCKAFLFPTIYEGFGLPPLEALGSGCKRIVVSDTPVMHEVLGESVNYIDPKDATSFKTENEVNSSEVLSKYSWNQSARLLYSALRKEANRGH